MRAPPVRVGRGGQKAASACPRIIQSTEKGAWLVLFVQQQRRGRAALYSLEAKQKRLSTLEGSKATESEGNRFGLPANFKGFCFDSKAKESTRGLPLLFEAERNASLFLQVHKGKRAPLSLSTRREGWATLAGV